MVDWTRLPGIGENGGWRNYVVGAGYVLLVLIIIGAVVGDPEADEPAPELTPTPTEEPAATPTPATDGGTAAPTEESTPTRTATSTPTPAQPSTLGSIQSVGDYHDSGASTFSGSGQTVTDVFEHPGGLLVLDYQHDGSSNFIVEIYDEDSGERVDIPINKIGSIDGATGLPLPEGEYSFDVDADGSWEIAAASPRAPDGQIQAPPASAAGDGPDVVGPIRLDGTVTVTGSHEGDSNFIVWLHNEDEGSQFSGTNLFNEIGEVDEAETRESHTGVAWVVVEANGPWELEFE